MKTLIQAFLMKIERITELKHKNLLANSIFLVGNLMKVFQILNRQYSVFPEGKRAQRFLNENWKIPYFMWENLWPYFDMWNRHFLISCQSICLQIFITLPCTTSWTQFSDFTFTFHFHAFEKEMATHSSVLAWRIPGTREPGGLPSMGSHRVGQDWSDLVHTHCMCLGEHQAQSGGSV